LTGLGDGVFFLTVEEALDTLNSHENATRYISTRKDTYERYKTLPHYPTLIRGRFDPILWAADPDRSNNVFDSNDSFPISDDDSNTIIGAAGAAGRVEGFVRRLDSLDEGTLLQDEEILVTALTNIGWTLLFPRDAAIVTDVGAPLSHAAIVARELGIPAVVGCGNATMRLKTGDRVRVDGGRGVVDILEFA
jgi:phosphohistidine swiveling domain-containing protein